MCNLNYTFVFSAFLGVNNLAGEVGCMHSEGPWVFVGLPNFVMFGLDFSRMLTQLDLNLVHIVISLLLYLRHWLIISFLEF